MKRLLLKNATLERLTKNQVVFRGELKGYYHKLTYAISEDRYYDLKQLSLYKKYNMWLVGDVIRFSCLN